MMFLKINISKQQWEKKLCIHVCVTWSPCCTVGKKIKIILKNLKIKKKNNIIHSLVKIHMASFYSALTAEEKNAFLFHFSFPIVIYDSCTLPE